MNTTPQNLENIKALASYIAASSRLIREQRRVCC